MEEQKPRSQPTSSPTLKPLGSALNSALSSMTSSVPSETGQPPKAKDTAIGRQDSAATSGALQVDAGREEALTQSQLTSIASRILSGPCTVISKTEKIRGRKKITDDFGTYWLEDEPIGTREVFDVSIPTCPNIPERALEAAQRRSPIEAYLNHLTHLAMHKILGSALHDRTVLLKDYAVSLSQFPEFIAWQACKWFWEKDPNKFFPKIIEITDLCEKIQAQIPLPASQQITHANAAPSKPRAVREEDSVGGKQRRETIIQFLRDHGETKDYGNERLYSNYNLEMTARRHGWTGWAKSSGG